MTLHRKLFFLFVLFLPTQLGFHFWPSWSSILGRYIDYLSPTLYFTDVVVISLLVVWLHKIGMYTIFCKRIVHLRGKEIFLLLFVGIFVIINIFFAHNMMVASVAWARLFLYVLLGLYIYQQRVTTTEIVKPLALGIICVSLIGISQYVLQRSIGGPLWLLGERTFMVDTPAIARISLCHIFNASCELRLRAYATFSHPNVLGGYLAITLPIVLWEVMKKHTVMIWRVIYGFSFVLGLVTLGVSFSRSAWLVAAFGVICVYLYRQGVNRLRFPIIIGLSIVVAVGFLVAPIQEESVVVRQLLNSAAISIWRESPFIGVGLNNFLLGLSPALTYHQTYILQPVHNIYLLFLSQIGLVGASIILGGVVLFFRHTSLRFRQFTPLYISFLSMLFLGMVDHYLLTLQQGQLLVCVIVSMTIVALSHSPKS